MKRRYDFRLARVLHVRELAEQDARAELAAERATLARAETALAATRTALQDARAQAAQLRASGSVDPVGTLAADRGMDALVLHVRRGREQVEACRARVAAAREAWQDRERSRRALVELEERGRVRHRQALNALENAEMDEIAGVRDTLARRAAEELAHNPEADSSGLGAAADLLGARPPRALER